MSARDESISNADFGRLRSLIYEQSGINLSAEKKTMLELRIKRRLRSLNLNSFAQYCEYLFGPHGQKEEIVHLLDVVSTNKTDFFREPEHFEFIWCRRPSRSLWRATRAVGPCWSGARAAPPARNPTPWRWC
jgi:chemotaxis protein methyltransferase CheR